MISKSSESRQTKITHHFNLILQNYCPRLRWKCLYVMCRLCSADSLSSLNVFQMATVTLDKETLKLSMHGGLGDRSRVLIQSSLRASLRAFLRPSLRHRSQLFADRQRQSIKDFCALFSSSYSARCRSKGLSSLHQRKSQISHSRTHNRIPSRWICPQCSLPAQALHSIPRRGCLCPSVLMLGPVSS